MKLTEIYHYMATHDSHSKFWTCDAELTAFSSCRKSRFSLKNNPVLARALNAVEASLLRLQRGTGTGI